MNDNAIPQKVVGIPSWISGSSSDLRQVADDLVSLYFWGQVEEQANRAGISVDSTIENIYNDAYVHARLMAEAHLKAFEKSNDLSGILQRVGAMIAYQIKKYGYFKYLEIADIQELYKGMENEENRPIMSELAFLSGTLTPIMEANGFPVWQIFSVAENFQKARFAVPTLRRLLDDAIYRGEQVKKAMSEEDVSEQLAKAYQIDESIKEALELLVDEIVKTKKDGGLTIEEFRKRLSNIVRKSPGTLPADGYIAVLPKGGVLLVVAEDTRQLELVKKAIQVRVDLHLSDVDEIERKLNDTRTNN